ncbi:hypothetical protein DFJ74DRAFT_672537 [Hyaloraphidium curvatum]|nr:hypothetical protein DFJ74DRAFT_672537 [Hyaloraphidium curvatum]
MAAAAETAVRNALARYFSALDGREWQTCLDSFCPVFDADYTAIVGGEPFKDLPREANMAAWSGMMAGFLSTRHDVEITFLDADAAAGTAALRAGVTATHVLPPEDGGTEDRVWTTIGSYSMKLQKGDDGRWRIKALAFKQHSSEPESPLQFMEEAKARAAVATTSS